MNGSTGPMRNMPCASFRTRQAGVGLIEVLIAVLVLSIGFLGIAALQARSLSMNNSSMARSVAVIGTYSILDAMRADLVSAQNGAYNNKKVTGDACPTDTSTLAGTQLAQWCGQLAAGLGATASTTGTVACTGTAGDCTVTVTYGDSKSGAAGTGNPTGTQTVTTRAML